MTIFAAGSLAQAKTYHSASDTAAVIYFMENESTVNALYCDEVDKSAAKTIMKALKSNPTGYNKEKCQKLSDKGITLSSIKKKIPEIKQPYIQMLAFFSKMMGGMTKGFTGDSDTGKEVEDLFSTLTDQQKAQVEQLKAEDLFAKLISEAKIPMVKSVDSKELNEEHCCPVRRIVLN